MAEKKGAADTQVKNEAAKNDAAVKEKDAAVKDVTEDKKKDAKTEEQADKKADKKAEDEAKKEILDEIDDDGDLILEDIRESIALTPENTRFYRSGGNLVSMELTNPDGKVENFERVVLLRAFPLTNPDEFVIVRVPSADKKGRTIEVGMIRYMKDFDEETNMLLREDLDWRYFTPSLSKIYSVTEKFGYTYWDVETSAGRITFILGDIFNAIRLKDDGSVMINDIDGNVYTIHDPQKLDSASYKKIEIYL